MCHANNENWNRQMTGRQNQEKIKTLREKKTYKYWGILEKDTTKHGTMKEKFWRTRKLPETK